MTRQSRQLPMRPSLLLALVLSVCLCPTSPAAEEVSAPRPIATESTASPSSVSVDPFDYARLFALSRKLMIRGHVREFLRKELAVLLSIPPMLAPDAEPAPGNEDARTRTLSEGQLIALLQSEPSLWPELEAYLDATPENLEAIPKGSIEASSVAELRIKIRRKLRTFIHLPATQARLQLFSDPTRPVVLASPDGGPAYSDARFYANHSRYRNGHWLAAKDLEKVWIEFIRKAKKQVALNVFDFDLISVADALIEVHRRGVDARVGIDAGVIAQRPEVKLVYEKLIGSGVKVTAVDSVGLNHQKMAARDWDDRANAAVLFSSGNLTQSCLGAAGDLGPHLPPSPYSIPNANHVFTMKSWVLAQLINHELVKTIDLKLRGTVGDRAYPLNGAFQVKGAGGASITIAFSPGGGLADINEHIIARTIFLTSGPVRMAQFAFSSPKVENALYHRARAELSKNGKFDFRSVGDKPFALAFWSMFLKMSGLTLPGAETQANQAEDEAATGEFEKAIEMGLAVPLVPSPKMYQTIAEDRWATLLGQSLPLFRDSIRVAPEVYGTHMVKGVQVTSKIHHKMILTGPALITGSFNFSESALKNQEYIMVIIDPYFKAEAEAMFDGLWRQTTPELSVAKQAVKRNQLIRSER